jgi:hypothetical protein
MTFADLPQLRNAMTTLAESKFRLSEGIAALNASGGTALYEAIKAAIEVSDAAAGPPDAIRAVVVLTDGKATAGQTGLSDLLTLSSRSEVPVPSCRAFENSPECVDAQGRQVNLTDVIGTNLKIPTRHNIQVFFIGIGDADLNVGRIIAQATGAEFQGATEKDLARVLEAFSKYF